MKKQTSSIIFLVVLLLLLVAVVSYLLMQGTKTIKVEGKIVFQSGRNIDYYRLGPGICVLKDGKIVTLIDGIMPSWSSDGKKILYIGGRGEKEGIYTMNEDGTDKRLIFKKEKDALIQNPTFSPSGKEIAFVSDIGNPYKGVGGFQNIFTIDVDGRNLKKITDFGQESDLAEVRYSPNGGKTIFRYMNSRTEEFCIKIMNIDGSDIQDLAKGFSPRYSPDGKQIVFGNKTDKGIPKVFIMNSDGTNKKQLTFGNWRDTQPVFSPDGKKVCFASYRHSNMPWESELFVINIDGTGEARITPPAFIPGTTKFVTDSNPDWHE